MKDLLFGLARPMLHGIEPERAHELTLRALEFDPVRLAPPPTDPALNITVMGLRFANPVGLAAGFDKDARVVDASLRLGFGFTEAGTLTPRPQEGNPRPRVFRLPADHAIINRLGFNNAGHAAALMRLRARAANPAVRSSGIVGVNVGANKDTADRIADYVSGYEAFAGVADYITLNISSPNTPGLRDLQGLAALERLLTAVEATRARLRADGRPCPPIVVKLAPDLAEADIALTAMLLEKAGAGAIAVSNTTLTRPGLNDPARSEAGGLSGRPLFQRSTIVLARVFEATGGRVPLIGIGGIDSEETALAKIEAGASLIQLYTGLVYAGPGVIDRIKAGLAAAARTGPGTLQALTGRKARQWAHQSLP